VKPGDTLNDRYEILRELGRGGAGITSLARDLTNQKIVVVKLLHLGLLGDWKTAELFEREASVLRQLHHERIPAYVDFLSLDLEGAPRFALVREYVEGTSLQSRIDAGWRGTEAQIRDIGSRLLRIVAYIHDLRPPVIHRDINPRNIIAREDGEVSLVDFGGVQDAIRLSTGATSTIVGTPGYTPMEQFVGRATPRSDLYAVAATLLYLLTHRNPADLPVRDMKIDFASVIDISSPGLSRVLSSWLEPDEAKRTLPLSDAVALLEGTAPAARPPEADVVRVAPSTAPAAVPLNPPHGSRLRRTEENGVAKFLIPGEMGGRSRRGFASFGFVWIAFAGIWSSRPFVNQSLPGLQWILPALPFVVAGLGMVTWVLSAALSRLGIEIDRNGLTYAERRFFATHRTTVPLVDVGECTIEEGNAGRENRGRASSYIDMRYAMRAAMRSRYSSRRPTRLISLDVGARTLRFGDALSDREKEWLRDAINEELRKARQ
jgi:serine/threonine protein kinase